MGATQSPQLFHVKPTSPQSYQRLTQAVPRETASSEAIYLAI